MTNNRMDLAPQHYQALLRLDFATFIDRAFGHVNPATVYRDNWHLQLLAAKLEACRTGKTKRLLICLPPRHLKSICASVALPAWWLGHHPSAQILCVSYAQDLADKHAQDCRSVMTSPWYHQLFPGTRLSPHRQGLQEFTTTHQGFRLATSVGGVITGRGADVIIIDDPLKPEEALSESQRKKANDWYSHTLYSRLNSKQDGVMILIMQRLHEDDLVGHVRRQEPWEELILPAIAEEDETHAFETVFGPQRHVRQKGEALHPEREPVAALEKTKKALGSMYFATQYQQRPAPLDGGLVQRTWFKTYNAGLPRAFFDEVVQSWDTANKASELANYSVCTTWGKKDERIYLLDVYREQVNFPDLKRAVEHLRSRWQATALLIEDRASGTSLIQELQAGGVPVHAIEPAKDKLMRLYAQTAIIENGFVYLPTEAPWLEAYLHELLVFPKGRYDDQVDSTTQALAWIKEARVIFNYDMGHNYPFHFPFPYHY